MTGLFLALSLILALTVSFVPRWRGLAFGSWVLVSVLAALCWPDLFSRWGDFRLTGLIVPLIQIIMFGMGTTLSLQDFSRAFTRPRPVLIGISLQFLIMPLLGATLAKLFQLEPEIAAGVVLTGSCPGGVASNVMAYLAGGNVALSVTMTACSTLLSPVMTPLFMQGLAGTFVPIDIWAMMLSILNMIITPIIAGLIAHELLYHPRSGSIRKPLLIATFLNLLVIAASIGMISADRFGSLAPLQPGLIMGLLLLSLTCLGKLLLPRPEEHAQRIDRCLSLLSMASICLIIAIITAQNHQVFYTAGLTLFFVCLLHNSCGFLSGYWLSRLLRLDEADSRTVAIEVGMQNSGMAAGLAIHPLQSTAAALAPAIFSPTMNIAGSLLASWWKAHPVRPTPAKSTPVEQH